MSKRVVIIIAGAAAALIIAAGVFIGLNWQAIQGARVAFGPPVGNIAETIKNETDIPLQLPEGFRISVFAEGLDGARDLAEDPRGVLFLSLMGEGRVVALPDGENDGSADQVVDVLTDLRKPHGLAFNCDPLACYLYVAEEHQVSRFLYNAEDYSATAKEVLVDLPTGGNHVTRSLVFNNGRLYISVGSTCNVCLEDDWRRAVVLEVNPDGSGLRVYASGLRNAVFLTNHPNTNAIWVTEMGRDWLGDDLPPDEINILNDGAFYGWPYCYGENIHDTNFDASQTARARCGDAEPSHIDIMPAHSAPLGLAFAPDSWHQEYEHDLFVAFHGSWNRTVPTGYKIYRYQLNEEGEYQGEEDFISGWLTDEGALGRPVDILFSDGNMLISDDKAGVVYLVERR